MQAVVTQTAFLLGQYERWFLDLEDRHRALEPAPGAKTAGWLLDAATGQELPVRSCTRRLSLDDKSARQALEGSAPGASAETAATPLIVRDMLKRAGCRLTDR